MLHSSEGKKMDGNGCTEGRFYFSLGEVLELSTFGGQCWQVGALLENSGEQSVLGRRTTWSPCLVVVSCSGPVQAVHGLHDGGSV